MNSEVNSKDWAGQVVDARFRLVQWLGSSGQSSVFLCEIDENPEQKAAIKLFPAGAEGAEECAAGWGAVAGLYHPHLVQVLYTGRDRINDTDILYVVTEYAGEILSEILPERPLTPDEVKEMLGPMFDALAYLHQNGFVHTRIKPSNIMVVDDQLKLSLENARIASEIGRPPEVLEIYDAPERALGKAFPASDLWSLGVTLVEALTRIPPAWNRTSDNEPIVPPSISEPFARIARECLRGDPELRCTLNDVKACLETGAAIPHRSVAPTKKPARGGRRAAVLGLCAVVLIAVFAIVMVRWHSARSDTTSSSQQAPAAAPTPESTPPAQQADSAPQAQTAQQHPAPVPPAQPEAPASEAAAPQPAPMPQVKTPAPEPPQGLAAKGSVAQQVLPDAPEKAIRTIQGTVKVSIQVNVDPSGAVSNATIYSQGPSQYFANLALKAAHSWKFAPARVGGQGVASVWLLHFLFRQSGVQAIPVEQTP